MIKSKLAITIDTISITTIIAIIIFVWLNKFIKNAILSLFVCNFAFILLFVALYRHFIKKYNLSKLKLKDEKLAKNCFGFLEYCSNIDFQNYIKHLLNCTPCSNHIFENDNYIFYINLKTPLTKNDFFIAHNHFLNSQKSKNLIFISSSQTEDFNQALTNCPTKYYTFNQVDLFKLMKEKNLFPLQENIKTNNKPKLKNIKNLLSKNITKNRFKEFFFSGLGLIFISFVIPFTLYYLIFGTLLLSLSIISLFNKSQTITTENSFSLCDLIIKK